MPTLTCRVCGSEALSLEERAAAVERRIISLTATLSALRRATQAQTVILDAAAEQTIDIGRLRLTLGGRDGSRLDIASSTPLVERVPRAPTRPAAAPGPDMHVAAQAEIWDALRAGLRIIRIVGAPGSGVTTLLEALATSATHHGYPAALQFDAVCGPARDVAQQLAMRLSSSSTARYVSVTELGQDFTPRRLVIFDGTDLTSCDLRSLCALLPGAQFVIAQPTAPKGAATIELDTLRPAEALLLMASAYGREIDSDNRRIALDLCLTTGLAPGPVHLIATAARAMQRSFISLRIQYDTGDATLRAFLNQLPPLEKRLLATLHAAQAPLGSAQLGSIIAESALRPALERLVDLALVRRTDDGFELPGFVAHYVAAIGAFPDFAAPDSRILGVLRSTLDGSPLDGSTPNAPASPPAFARRLAAIERLLQTARQAGHWDDILTYGPPLAQAYAAQGSFGAWGRVLEALEAAATHAGDRAELARTWHELGIRAVLLGEPERALIYLRPALTERRQSDEPAAAATAAVIALADRPLPAGAASSLVPLAPPDPPPATNAIPLIREVTARTASSRWRAQPRRMSLAPAALALLGLAFIACAIIAFFAVRPPRAAFAITHFTSDARAIARDAKVTLCVVASAAAVVDIFPGAIRLAGSGRQCVAVWPRVTTTYIAVASNADGRQLRAALVINVFAPVVTRRLTIGAFSARPARIAAGGLTQLCYRVTGARRLRLIPHIGNLTRLQTCEEVRLITPARHTYRLVAFGDDGQTATRLITVDVRARPTPPLPATSRSRPHRQTVAVYQFDATPAVVRHGQSTSLCAGVERSAHGYVTHVGRLQSGVTRCYRVLPQRTTTYRLYVRTPRSIEIRTMTVYVQPPGQITR